MNRLWLEKVEKTYGKGDGAVQALRNVTLSLDAGAFAAVRGPSGCGKTTLLLTAGGLLRPENGTVSVGSEHLYTMPLDKRAAFRAAHIGFVFQQFHLIPYLTVVENILVPCLEYDGGKRRARAAELLRRFNLDARANHKPEALSTGERQRTAMARSLINAPVLMLADEPTGNLDEMNAAIVLDALASFAESGGAVLLVTHSREAAERAHTIYEMKDGVLEVS